MFVVCASDKDTLSLSVERAVTTPSTVSYRVYLSLSDEKLLTDNFSKIVSKVLFLQMPIYWHWNNLHVPVSDNPYT